MNLVIDSASSKRDEGLWRFDSALLDNLDVVRLMTEETEQRRKKDVYAGQNGAGALLETLFGNIRGICICKSAQIVKF